MLLFSRFLARVHRTEDELVQTPHDFAHFYYKGKSPSWIDKAKLTPYS